MKSTRRWGHQVGVYKHLCGPASLPDCDLLMTLLLPAGVGHGFHDMYRLQSGLTKFPLVHLQAPVAGSLFPGFHVQVDGGHVWSGQMCSLLIHTEYEAHRWCLWQGHSGHLAVGTSARAGCQ
jgi:hypothetical protein